MTSIFTSPPRLTRHLSDHHAVQGEAEYVERHAPVTASHTPPKETAMTTYMQRDGRITSAATDDMPERIWLDTHSYNGAVGFAHPEKHKKDGWPVYIRADLCDSGQQVRDVMAAADRDADRCAERIAELERLLDKARAEAKRMDLARDQFLGERNMLAEALRDIQRGDMTGMMELTEAEAAKARATWALKRIGTPVAALTPAGGWQPIETAPHETLVVLGWYEGDVWKQEITLASAGNRYPNGYSDRWHHGRATHWTPLPAAPDTTDNCRTPPRPSETVAEAINAVLKWENKLVRSDDDLKERNAAFAALRALKGANQ